MDGNRDFGAYKDMQKNAEHITLWTQTAALMRSKVFWICLTNSLLMLLFVFHPLSVEKTFTIAMPSIIVLPLIGTAWAFAAAIRDWSGRKRGAHWSACAFGIAGALFSIGLAINIYYGARYHGMISAPIWVDGLFLSIQPMIVVGILCLPMRSVPAALRMRILLDCVMIMTAVIIILWKFLLGPALLQSGEPTVGQISRVISPISNLMLFFSLMTVSSHLILGGVRRIVRVLFVSFLLIFGSNIVFGYQMLHHTFHMGTINDVACTAGYMLLGLVGSWLPSAVRNIETTDAVSAETERSEPEIVLWRTLLPYALLPFVGAILIDTMRLSDGLIVQTGVFMGAAVLLGLMLFRQITAIFETRQLYGVLQGAYEDLSVNNEQLHLAQLEMAAQNDELHTVRAVLETQNLSLAEANLRLETLAVTDGLTGLKNHRTFQERLEIAWKQAEGTGGTLALLLLDVDHFKRFNDTWGHPAGDEVLKSVAKAISGQMRTGELAARYGGEEFAVLLPSEGITEAQECAERIRVAIESIIGIQQSVTVSIGVAELGPGISTGAELLARADAALYSAKADGRNCVRSGASVRALSSWAA